MAAVSISLTKLESAADKATSVKGALGDYADEIPRYTTTPLANLQDGESAHTRLAASRARAKVSSLDERADDYAALSRSIDTFVGAVRTADANVERSIEALTDQYVAAMSFWQKASYCFEATFNDVLGSTSLGKALNVLHDACEFGGDLYHDMTLAVRDFFKYGDGKYVLNIAISLVGLAAAFFTILAGGSVIVVILSVIAFVGAAINFGVTLGSNITAMALNDTEPGLSHYYGSVETISDYANKTSTNATWRGIANAIETTRIIASIGSFAGGWTKNLSSGAKTSKVVKDYFAGKFGLSWSDASNAYKFTANSVFGVKNWSSMTCFDKASDVLSWTKRGLSSTRTLVDGVDSVDDVFDMTKNIFGGFSGVDKIYGTYKQLTSK